MSRAVLSDSGLGRNTCTAVGDGGDVSPLVHHQTEISRQPSDGLPGHLISKPPGSYFEFVR